MSIKNQKIKESDLVKSLEKGLIVIQAFSENTRALTITQAAQITGLSKPATRRILLTLAHLDYLEQNEQGEFKLTPKILSLGYAYFSSNKIWKMTTPYLEQLSQIVGESSSISVLDGQEIVYVSRYATKNIMSVDLNVGARLPAHVTAMGQVMLAYASERKLQKYLQAVHFEKYTEHSIIDEASLSARLEVVRNQGYVLVQEELEIGLSSLAAPIFNAQNEVVAAINISMHSLKIQNKDQVDKLYVPDLLTYAKKISDLMKTIL